MNVVRGSPEWHFRIGKNSVNRDGGIVNCSHERREARSAGVMPILIPPSVFGEMKAIFDSPVVSDVPENVVG